MEEEDPTGNGHSLTLPPQQTIKQRRRTGRHLSAPTVPKAKKKNTDGHKMEAPARGTQGEKPQYQKKKREKKETKTENKYRTKFEKQPRSQWGLKNRKEKKHDKSQGAQRVASLPQSAPAQPHLLLLCVVAVSKDRTPKTEIMNKTTDNWEGRKDFGRFSSIKARLQDGSLLRSKLHYSLLFPTTPHRSHHPSTSAKPKSNLGLLDEQTMTPSS